LFVDGISNVQESDDLLGDFSIGAGVGSDEFSEVVSDQIEFGFSLDVFFFRVFFGAFSFKGIDGGLSSFSGFDGQQFFIDEGLDLFNGEFFVFSEDGVQFVESQTGVNDSLLFSSELGLEVFQLSLLFGEVVGNLQVVQDVSEGSHLDDLGGNLGVSGGFFSGVQLLRFSGFSIRKQMHHSINGVVKVV